MKLFSWINDLKSPTFEGDENGSAEPSLSPVLEARLAELEQTKVKDVMTPRSVVVALDADVQLRRVRRLKSAKVVYFPVYRGDLDHIIGWVSKQKVLNLLSENSEDNNLAANARPVGHVSEDATVADLADIFLKAASPFLVVKNMQGTTTGIVALSEFVELIFGFDLDQVPPQPAPEAISPNNYEL